MKFLLFLIVFSLTIPTFATCEIETGAACTAQFKEIDSPTGSSRRSQQEFLDAPKPDTNPKPDTLKQKTEFQDFGNKPQDYSYNADCQFGVCKNSSGAPQLFQNRER